MYVGKATIWHQPGGVSFVKKSTFPTPSFPQLAISICVRLRPHRLLPVECGVMRLYVCSF